MADQNEEKRSTPDIEDTSLQDEINRAISENSGNSIGSKKSVTATVSQLTAKALREFRLDDEVLHNISGELNVESFHSVDRGLDEENEQQTLLQDKDGENRPDVENIDRNQVEFDENVDVVNTRDFIDEGDVSDDENDLVVLDPEHVSTCQRSFSIQKYTYSSK